MLSSHLFLSPHVIAAYPPNPVTEFTRLNSVLDQTPHIEAKLQIKGHPGMKAAPSHKNTVVFQGLQEKITSTQETRFRFVLLRRLIELIWYRFS